MSGDSRPRGKSERFNLRLDPEAKKRIEQAACFEASALAQAEQTIRKHGTMVLRRRDAEVIFDALLQPPRDEPQACRGFEGT